MYLTIGFWIAVMITVIYYAFYSLILFSEYRTFHDLNNRAKILYMVITPILIFGFIWILYPLIFGVIFGITILAHQSEQVRDWIDELFELLEE